MKVEYINPFIEAVHELFSTMLSSTAVRGEVGVSRTGPVPKDIMALIGLSGRARGMVSLAFPTQTALNMVDRLLGTKSTVIDDTVSDAVAELVNIVAGSAKAKFPSKEGVAPIDLSIPTVVRGTNYNIDYPKGSVWLEVPFTSDLGEFFMRVTFSFEDGVDGNGE